MLDFILTGNSEVLMHLLALGAFGRLRQSRLAARQPVLMHLLVLGACGLRIKDEENLMLESLNAPSGAGCFLTRGGEKDVRTGYSSLNVPSGAGCFLTLRHRTRRLPRITS